jgi:hypothetical protein
MVPGIRVECTRSPPGLGIMFSSKKLRKYAGIVTLLGRMREAADGSLQNITSLWWIAVDSGDRGG